MRSQSSCLFLLMVHLMFPQAAPSLPTENAVQCRRTTYGCCYDRTSVANGPNGEGCPNPPNHSKQQTHYYKLKSGFVDLLFFLIHMWICPVQTHSETLGCRRLKGLLTGFIVSMGKYAVYSRTPNFKLNLVISVNPVFCFFFRFKSSGVLVKDVHLQTTRW